MGTGIPTWTIPGKKGVTQLIPSARLGGALVPAELIWTASAASTGSCAVPWSRAMANKMGRRITEDPTVTGVLPKSRGDENQEISADGATDHRATGASGAGAVRRSPRGE